MADHQAKIALNFSLSLKGHFHRPSDPERQKDEYTWQTFKLKPGAWNSILKRKVSSTAKTLVSIVSKDGRQIVLKVLNFDL